MCANLRTKAGKAPAGAHDRERPTGRGCWVEDLPGYYLQPAPIPKKNGDRASKHGRRLSGGDYPPEWLEIDAKAHLDRAWAAGVAFAENTPEPGRIADIGFGI